MLRSLLRQTFVLSKGGRCEEALRPVQSLRRCDGNGIVDLSRRTFSSSNSPTVPEEELHIAEPEVVRFMSDCMQKVGTPAQPADMLARNLVEADLRGHPSHGLNRLAYYVEDIQCKVCDPRATPTVLKDGPSTAWVDGNNGLGVVVGKFSMELAIAKAKETGIGWVSAKGSNHFGICQWYTEMALEAGLIGIAATNTSPLVAPTRAKVATLGTNPISFAAPGSQSSDRLLLDMSTSAVALGKIEIQRRKKEPVPIGWAMDQSGRDTTDSALAQTLMPLGGNELNSGYKGYGLGLVVELLCGLMSGANYAHRVRPWTEHDRSANLGQCFVAVDPERFAPGMGDRLQDLMDHLRQMDPSDPSRPVLVPGDPELHCKEEIGRRGTIRYTPDHITSYRKLAQQLDVQPMQHGKRQ